MQPAGIASQAERAKRLIEHSRTTVDASRDAITRARVVTITAQHLQQTAQATRYENRLIRAGLRR
jgi:hypothetical protein